MIRPLRNVVIVEPLKEKDGIILTPDQYKEKTGTGLVIWRGNDSVLEEGDEIFYKPYAGMELRHEGMDLVLLGEEEVLAVFKKA